MKPDFSDDEEPNFELELSCLFCRNASDQTICRNGFPAVLHHTACTPHDPRQTHKVQKGRKQEAHRQLRQTALTDDTFSTDPEENKKYKENC